MMEMYRYKIEKSREISYLPTAMPSHPKRKRMEIQYH